MSTLSFEDTANRSGLGHHVRRGGGIRDKVRGFSKASRRNLLRRLASVDRGAFRAFEGRVLFVTLTYPHVWPENPEACKGHLKAFRKRLQREFGPFAAFWRLGIQQRGTAYCSSTGGQVPTYLDYRRDTFGETTTTYRAKSNTVISTSYRVYQTDTLIGVSNDCAN